MKEKIELGDLEFVVGDKVEIVLADRTVIKGVVSNTSVTNKRVVINTDDGDIRVFTDHTQIWDASLPGALHDDE